MLLIVLPGQLLGNFAGDRCADAERRAARPGGLGVLAVGWCPGRRGRGRTAAASGTATSSPAMPWSATRSALPRPAAFWSGPTAASQTTPGASAGDVLVGALIVAVVQTAAAVSLWLLRGRRTA